MCTDICSHTQHVPYDQFIVWLLVLSSYIRSRVQKFPAWPTFEGDRNKTTLLFFNIVSLYFNTLFNWYINLTIDGTIYPSQHFLFGAAFVCQAGNFWPLLCSYCFPTDTKIERTRLSVTIYSTYIACLADTITFITYFTRSSVHISRFLWFKSSSILGEADRQIVSDNLTIAVPSSPQSGSPNRKGSIYQKAKPNIPEDLKSREIRIAHLCMLRAYISIHSTNYFDKLRENMAHKTNMRIFNTIFIFEIPAHF